jgi:hypothetical protein
VSRQNEPRKAGSKMNYFLPEEAAKINIQVTTSSRTIELTRTGKGLYYFWEIVRNILENHELGETIKPIGVLIGVDELNISSIEIFDSNDKRIFRSTVSRGRVFSKEFTLSNLVIPDLWAAQDHGEIHTEPASQNISISVDISESASNNEVANEIADLCKALNAYHIAKGGNGLEIDSWEILVRELVRA